LDPIHCHLKTTVHWVSLVDFDFVSLNSDPPAHPTEGSEVSERSRYHSRDARHSLEEDDAVQVFVAITKKKKRKEEGQGVEGEVATMCR